MSLGETLGAERDAIKGITHGDEVFATGFGNDEALALSVEQLEAQRCFQSFHLVTDCTLRDAQLLGGSREALVPSRALEGFECIQGGQAAQHRADFMRKTKSA